MTWIVGIIALIVGLIIGFFGARKYMEKYLRENPPIDESQLSMMMQQMGRKPSQKKLHQMMNTMKNNNRR